jgi:outer membrane protein TolC
MIVPSHASHGEAARPLTLSGSLGSNSASIATLLHKNGTFWSIGANVAAPVFRGSTLWSERQAAPDALEVSQANYRQTVLNAFVRVADTLQALEHDAVALNAQSHALSASGESLRLLRANYQGGIVNYLQILIADSQYHSCADLGGVGYRARNMHAKQLEFIGSCARADRID